MTFQTPILVIAFNRPSQTAQVMSVLKELKPAYLFLAADGPREGNQEDIANCKKVRELLMDITWECKVEKRFLGKNIGCGKGVSGAITWFFENVEEGIILEDDIVPDQSFFPYCEELLETYRDDTRVMAITGRNILGEWKPSRSSYFFTDGLNVWGWATWRRAWRYFDYDLRQLDLLQKEENLFNKYGQVTKDSLKFFESMRNIDTWDYQWAFAMEMQSGYTIVPSVNLVKNTGLGEGATHTKVKDKSIEEVSVHNIERPLQAPPGVYNDLEYMKIFWKKSHPNVLEQAKKIVSYFIQNPKGFLNDVKKRIKNDTK